MGQVERYFGSDVKVKLQTLWMKLELLKMKNDEKLSDYISRLLTLTNQMKQYGQFRNKAKIIEKVLRIFPSLFDHIVVTIKEIKDLDIMKIEELQSTLKVHEIKVAERENEK